MLELLIEERKRKLKNIRDKGIDPYPASSKRAHTASYVVDNFSKLSKTRKKVYLTGRIRALRDQGGVIFIDLKDESSGIQVVLKKDNLKDFNFWKENLDLGDFIEAEKIVKDENHEDRKKTQEELFAFLETLGISKADRVIDGKYDIMLYEKFGLK